MVRKINILLALIPVGLFCFSLAAQTLHAQIFKWTDEKGTIHFTQDPSTIPEKYREQVKSREMEEFPDEPKKAEPPRPAMQQPEGWKPGATAKPKEEEPTPQAPSPGFIPFDKFKYLTKGMSEAEVLSRFGPPTREERDEEKTRGTVSGGTVSGYVHPGGTVTGTVSGGTVRTETIVIKRFYYIGDPSRGEKTTIIHIKKGKVFKYDRI